MIPNYIKFVNLYIFIIFSNMDYISPKLIKYLNTNCKLRNNNYNFLDFLDEYLETNLIYDYLLSSIEYKHKNIWNSLVQNWNDSKKNKEEKLDYINDTIIDSKLNDILNQFIQGDTFKAIYVIVVIQKHI